MQRVLSQLLDDVSLGTRNCRKEHSAIAGLTDHPPAFGSPEPVVQALHSLLSCLTLLLCLDAHTVSTLRPLCW